MASDAIVIRGAREHNLRNVDVSIPRDKLVVITGLSGSGKSSLAFDTIYAEGQRRFASKPLELRAQFSARWTSQTWTPSTACRKPSPSTRRPRARTPAPPWAP